MINPSDIKPMVKGYSDFFSWQLHMWAKKKPDSLRIWSGTWNSFTGIDPEKQILYIGSKRDNSGWIYGKELRQLCSYGASLDRWAYGPNHDTANWVDVTDKFWSDYMEKGVCAIHGDYAHSWVNYSEFRECEYCGKKQKRVIKMVETHSWEDL